MIVVCGEALIDVIKNGNHGERSTAGGGPFNTARALARLGIPTAFLGRLSSDDFGRHLAELLVADGVNMELASIGDERTTVANAVVDSSGWAEYEFIVESTSAPNLTRDMLPQRLAPDVRAIHLGTLGLVLEPMASTLVELVRRERSGRLVMLDPNVRSGLVPDDEYRQRIFDVVGVSTVVKASSADLHWLYSDADHYRAANQLAEAGVRLVIVTLGSEGAYALHCGHRVHVDAYQVNVVDTIGAGDSFGAAVLAWLHDHELARPDLVLDQGQLKAALQYACMAAALTCTRPGANPPSRQEMVAAGFQ